MSGLTIGTLTLEPSFDKDVVAYTVTTSNNTNKVTATPTDENATVEISLGAAPVENGSQVTWETGENTLTIVVTNGSATTTYTVTVTKE